MTRIVVSLLLFLSLSVQATDNDAIARIFNNEKVQGTIVISSVRSQKTFIFNESRAAERFAPASSFKVFNTLIALETSAVSGKNEVLNWDGKQYEIDDWNHDQTLESAFRVSCVWCYQELASRVGKDRYRRYLLQANYGQLAQDFNLTNFWLDGALKISAQEQVAFLKQIYLRQLPFSARNYEILQEVMLAERMNAYKLYAKTGWAARMKPQVGWYVGYIETSDDVWVFATNIVTQNEADLPKRQRLTKSALIAVGIIPANGDSLHLANSSPSNWKETPFPIAMP